MKIEDRKSPNRRSPPVIGLVGGIGSGKSTVARILAELGCLVSNSDEQARAALRDPGIKAALLDWWGTGILDSSGEIDRSAVARIIFADPAQRKRLEGLTHPWIEARRRELFAAAPAQASALVIDAPLLLEAGLDAECDAIIFVDADPATRAQRVARARGWDAQGGELARREASQLPLDEKRRRADYVVENNGDLAHLEDQVRRILNAIVQAAGSPMEPGSRDEPRGPSGGKRT